MQSLSTKLSQMMGEMGITIRVNSMSDLIQDGSLDVAGETIISLLEAEEPVIASWTSTDFQNFKDLTSQAAAILWITRGGAYQHDLNLLSSVTTGLLRTVRVETPQLKLPHIDLSPASELSSDENATAIVSAFKSSIIRELGPFEQEYRVENDKTYVPRLSNQDSFHAELASNGVKSASSIVRLGDISQEVFGYIDSIPNSLAWRLSEPSSSAIGELDIEVETTAVNMETSDIKNEGIIGRDAVGIVTKRGSGVTKYALGDPVVVCASGTLKSKIRVHQDLTMHLPAFTNPSQMAALPSALITAQAVLLDIARLQPGESLLISTVPGNLEHAMVYLARQLGAVLYAVAQSPWHKRHLIETLGIKESHIFRSTANSSFATQLSQSLNGRGINVIASTLSGDAAQHSIECLADFGRFVAIGGQSWNSISIDFSRNITISSFDLEHLKRSAPEKVSSIFQRAWDRARRHGLPSTTPIRIYPAPDAAAAIDYLTSDQCFGSAVVTFSPSHELSVRPPKPPKLKLDSQGTYILSGGLGGIGRSIADMMFDAGARNIAFLSRSGAQSEEAKQLLDSLHERGCNASAYRCDIADSLQVQTLSPDA